MPAKKEWTEARVRSFIISTLRAGSRRWPEKWAVLEEAKTEKKINKKTGRLAQHYRCNACKEEFSSKDIQVDHIKPIIDPKRGFVNWDTYIKRMFCGKENLQALCKQCHARKTKKERDARKQND